LDSGSHPLEGAHENNKLVFFLVEKGLLAIRSARTAFHYARNAQAFSERANRLLGVGAMSLLCPIASLSNRAFATRLIHLPLRGMSRDRLDLLGEEYFNHVLRHSLDPRGIGQVQQLFKDGFQVVLVSRELDHLIRPLAGYLNVNYLLANRLEFRDDLATGRLLDPIIPPLGLLTRPSAHGTGGLISNEELRAHILLPNGRGSLEHFIVPTAREIRAKRHPAVNFSRRRSPLEKLSVRQTLAGKNILLIGSTGFIGKVWLCTLLHDLPELGRIHLLIRRQGTRSAVQRFEKIVAESPAFKTLHDHHGEALPDFLGERVDIVEGDVSEPQLGLDNSTAARLHANLDLIVNSAGLTDFNPDLRLALSTNADSTFHLVGFLKKCDHAGLIHVSTCFVNGRTDGRVPEELHPNYTPGGHSEFDAQHEWQFLRETVERVTLEADNPERTEQFRNEALRQRGGQDAAADSRFVQNFVRKARTRWIREQLIELGIRQANRWGWPNIYTYTKSLGESLLAAESGGLPVAVVRPSIVESSVRQPFRGWNEGVNTTAPLSYLLGTYFRQLPSNKRKRLDVIPVDLVCRGLTLVCAAMTLRVHEKVYQLATSATNPADMRRAIELTGLAHRKHYGSLEGLEHWLRARFDTIPVSKTRYRNVSLPFFQLLLQGTRRVLAGLAFKGEALARKQRALERVQKVIELYEPFILDNEYFFAADHIKGLSDALPEEEVEAFGYNTEVIDWYDYWINLHVPALRRWTYPLIEGRRPETGLLPRNFRLPVRSSTEHTPNDLLQHATQGGD
jgi:nucleoside-diphosphate-sugar epimerase/phosphoserine phosphatase